MKVKGRKGEVTTFTFLLPVSRIHGRGDRQKRRKGWERGREGRSVDNMEKRGNKKRQKEW